VSGHFGPSGRGVVVVGVIVVGGSVGVLGSVLGVSVGVRVEGGSVGVLGTVGVLGAKVLA